MHKEWGTTQTQIADLNLSHVTYLIIIFLVCQSTVTFIGYSL